MNKKIVTIAIAIALIFTFSSSVSASSDSNLGKPFQAIWNAITGLQDKINNIQLIPGPQGLKGDQGIQGEQGLSGELPIGFLSSPAFDSGWVELSQGTVIDVPHNVGGDYNNYFIYATYRRPAENGTLKSHQTAGDVIWWEDVTSNNIQIITNGDVSNNFDAARIRIWVIQN